MNKPIADRFKEAFEDGLLFNSEVVACWLRGEPENSRTYSIQEVEAIAREFCFNASILAREASFEKQWANKLKELGK